MVVLEDTTDVASYAAQASVREFISFDTSKIAEPTVRYMGTKGHADVFFWDVRTPPDIPKRQLTFSCSPVRVGQLSNGKHGRTRTPSSTSAEQTLNRITDQLLFSVAWLRYVYSGG